VRVRTALVRSRPARTLGYPHWSPGHAVLSSARGQFLSGQVHQSAPWREAGEGQEMPPAIQIPDPPAASLVVKPGGKTWWSKIWSNQIWRNQIGLPIAGETGLPGRILPVAPCAPTSHFPVSPPNSCAFSPAVPGWLHWPPLSSPTPCERQRRPQRDALRRTGRPRASPRALGYLAPGLAAFGQEGVERVVEILRAELTLVMKQCGTPAIRQITPASIARRQP